MQIVPKTITCNVTPSKVAHNKMEQGASRKLPELLPYSCSSCSSLTLPAITFLFSVAAMAGHFPFCTFLTFHLYVFHGLPHHLSFSKFLLCQLAHFSTFLRSCLQAPHKTFGMEPIFLLRMLLCHNTHRKPGNDQTSDLLGPLAGRNWLPGYSRHKKQLLAFWSVFRVGWGWSSTTFL